MDGIAGVHCAFAGLALFLRAGAFGIPGASGLGLFVWGARMGFLVWNWYPARIFMGDAGSGFLGFAIGCFALAGAARSRSSFWTWLIAPGVFTADSSVILVVRVMAERSSTRPTRARVSAPRPAISRPRQSDGRCSCDLFVVVVAVGVAEDVFERLCGLDYGPR
jgi:UDP-N-acetylmuramyl pentapeptide phosphotransferase/UDP-N-acetylglucosamine-1-phosphate transferase